MRNLILPCLIAFIAIKASGQSSPLVTDSVTLFLSGAEIHCSEKVKLKRGQQVVTFKGLSYREAPTGINVLSDASAEIISVVVSAETIEEEQLNARVKTLLDSIEGIEDQLTSVANEIESYNAEKRTLEQNQQIKTASVGVSPDDITRYSQYFRNQNLKISTAVAARKKTEQQLGEKLEKIKAHLKAEKDNTPTARFDLVVVVNAKQDGEVLFRINYLVDQAHWEVSYDISAQDLSKPITLKYKADIYNQTGIDWKGVRVSLSTGDATQNTNLPALTTWVLNY